jgi:hypothetical protein
MGRETGSWSTMGLVWLMVLTKGVGSGEGSEEEKAERLGQVWGGEREAALEGLTGLAAAQGLELGLGLSST